jgi:hypothetical protein
VKTKNPDRRLPTKVEMTRPMVIEIMPAPVISSVAELGCNMFRMPKITTTAITAVKKY